MTDYKVYRVTGHFRKTKKKLNVPMMMEVSASNVKDAVEQVFSEVGSRHSVKRSEIFIPKEGGVVEITPEEAKGTLFRDVLEEDFLVYKQ